MELTPEQQLAFEILQSGENVFLSGGAGSGKSFLIRHFLQKKSPKVFPVLASTGAAAILVGGRTFHSFFGIGIVEGGIDATFERACRDKRLMRRLKKVEGFVIDEISMIPGPVLALAEKLSQTARNSSLPWGGLNVIAVGDFAQLPPVSRGERPWAFQEGVWERSGFTNILLQRNLRTPDQAYVKILNDIRLGNLTESACQFLNEKVCDLSENFQGTCLFPRKVQTEKHNQGKLAKLPGKTHSFPSIYFGQERFIDQLKRHAPIPEELLLKENARVMLIQNDPQQRWINGSTGVINEIKDEKLSIQLDSGRFIEIEKTTFSLQNMEGEVMASVINFPLILAYATTIHKSQGSTLENMYVDLTALWEPGQAYVALSRLKSSEGLFLRGWNPRSFIVDPKVMHFYQALEQRSPDYGKEETHPL